MKAITLTFVGLAAALSAARLGAQTAPAVETQAQAEAPLVRAAPPEVNVDMKLFELITAAPNYDLNRAKGGYFERRTLVRGEVDGTGADPRRIRMREAGAALVATKVTTPAPARILVGTDSSRFFNGGTHPDVLWLEEKGSTRRAVMLEGKGEDNFPSARGQFEGAAAALRDKGYSLLPDIAQMIVVPKITGQGWSVKKKDGRCALQKDREFVSWNGQPVWIVFGNINDEVDPPKVVIKNTSCS